MCDQCNDIDAKIARYKDIDVRTMDDLLTERIEALIADLLVSKEILHAATQE